MLDKITMISSVWMVMVGAMLATTVALYDNQPSNTSIASKAGVIEVTSRTYHLSQY